MCPPPSERRPGEEGLAAIRQPRRFADRDAAGQELGELVRDRVASEEIVVLAVPSGGVPVAAALARVVSAPLDLVDVHEITAHRPDLGVGAVSSTTKNVRAASARAVGMSDMELAAKTEQTQGNLASLFESLRAERGEEPLDGRVVVVVDDALAVTPAIATVADYARSRGAVRVILAVPVAIDTFATAAAEDYDEVLSLETIAGHLDLDDWYGALPTLSESEVLGAVLGR